MFKFYKNGKEINPPKRIKWYFDQKPDSQFESTLEKLEINQNYWRKQLGLGAEAQPVYIESPEFQIVTQKITPIQEDECTTTTATTTAEPNHSDVDGGLDPEFSISESPEATVYTAKRKVGKKAAKLSDVPADLGNDDSAATDEL
jgi:hypothetical protein